MLGKQHGEKPTALEEAGTAPGRLEETDPRDSRNHIHLNLGTYWIQGIKRKKESGMNQRFLVQAAQRIMLLFIKIKNTGGEAGLREENELRLEVTAV